MEHIFDTAEIRRMVKQERRRKTWKRVLSAMMCLVVFVTTYVLILPAITMETNTFCGIEEHVHDEKCYSAAELCGMHVHTGVCYAEQQNLICTESTEPVHIHTEECAPVSETLLTCDLEETEGHVHTEECAPITENLISCGMEETTGHTHTEQCFVTEQALTCALEETEEHTHGDGCYSAVTTNVCALEEVPAHTHSETCYTTVTTYGCGLEEISAHAHTEECYTTVTTYGCGLVEEAAHVHSESCYEQPLICTLEADPTHQHTDECGGGVLICEKEEHTHELMCYSDPSADLESAQYWEKTLPENLTGIHAKDVLTVAASQLGYTESIRNYAVEEGITKGYTRYGAWYGIPYGDWCAMYVSFCLHYAGVNTIPMNARCQSWIDELQELGMYHNEEDYIPRPGDIVFFDWEGDGSSDHVGLVAEVNGENLKTIEGNSLNTVRYVDYLLSDGCIQGYGQLPAQKEKISYLCGYEAHTHDENCQDAEGNRICTLEEHTHEDNCLGKKLFYTGNQIRATVTIRDVDLLPEDLSVQVWEITEEEDPAAYQGMESAVADQMYAGSRFMERANFYGMELRSQDMPYELPENAKVKVDVEFIQPPFSVEEMENAAEMKTFVLTPQQVSEEEMPTEELAEGETGEAEMPMMRLFSLRSSGEEEEEIEAIGYNAEPISGENYKDSAEGLTGLSFRSSRIATFAVALSTDIQEGTFWTRVTSTAELNAGGTFMIVSAEGNYALVGNSNNNYRAVTIQTVKGNTDYYIISGSDSADVRWTFTKNNNNYRIRNEGTSTYLSVGSSSVFSSSSQNITASYQTAEHTWRFSRRSSSRTYYLRNTGAGAAYYTSNEADSSQTGTQHSSQSVYPTADMMIFKLSDTTTLYVPKDVKDWVQDEGSEVVGPPKPDYGDFIDPSGSKTGDTAVTDTADANKVVTGKYYSDPATSDLETNYRKNTYAESTVIDGKIMTDKSVIYRGDDYDAFDSYDANTFGVTLSMLGQEYAVQQEDVINIPIDVVFVLDVSGSMTLHKTKDELTRMEALASAFNAAATEILTSHPENRIGVALYSTGAWQMLPLDRYVANTVTENGEEMMQLTTLRNVNLPYNSTKQFLIGSSSLKSETTNKSYSGAGWTGSVGGNNDIHQGVGTYTQAGIAMGYEILEANNDTTYTAVVNDREYEVIRQPVIVLLSDGEPTHATSIYMDPLNGPHYGDGKGTQDSGNINGIQGYYTVLSANYFKRMAGIHYGKETLFYTVGLGIKSANEANDDVNYDSSSNGSGDRYKRAVLDPSATNLSKLSSSNVNGADTAQVLKDLLNGNITDQALETGDEWLDPWLGNPHAWTPVLGENPYAGNFDYADQAYFGQMSYDELRKIFTDILVASQRDATYDFVLHENSTVDVFDTIGDGMEIKGDPILRYGGRNYTHTSVSTQGNVTTYVYDYEYVDPYVPDRKIDLKGIEVDVTRNADGNQVVSIHVLDTALPTYTPEILGKQYYYEALPARLIYQVGLTEASRQEVLALAETGGTLTYYTNVYENGEPGASATLIPSSVNPFYVDVPNDDKTPAYHAHNEQKAQNTTDTASYHVDCSMRPYEDVNTIYVDHKLGNNGKLVFTAEEPKLEIPVEKQWQGVNPDGQAPITITLYKVAESETSATAQVVKTLELSKDNGWSGSFDKLRNPGSGWYYAIGETVPEGFAAIYSGETVQAKLQDGDSAEYVTVTRVVIEEETAQKVTIKNLPNIELPDTGGSGTILYTAGGLLLIMAAVILLYVQYTKRRRGAA